MTFSERVAKAALLVGAMAAAPAVNARDMGVGPATYAVIVRHADLHPRTPSAARALLDRLDGAALDACGASPFSLREVKASVAASACWRQAMDDAVARVGEPLLSAAYQARQRSTRDGQGAGS